MVKIHTCIRVGDDEFKVSYLPGDSDNGMFGGNSNWRGPDMDAGEYDHHQVAF